MKKKKVYSLFKNGSKVQIYQTDKIGGKFITQRFLMRGAVWQMGKPKALISGPGSVCDLGQVPRLLNLRLPHL